MAIATTTTPDLARRVVDLCLDLEELVDEPRRRWAVASVGIAAAVLVHAAWGSPAAAWLAAVPAVLGGLVGGWRFGLTTALAAGAAHVGVDLAQGADAAVMTAAALRTSVLAALGLTGAAIRELEGQRVSALERAAREDAVTGLLNVRAFYDELRRLRDEDRPHAILLADIAGTGDLNERYGHPTGTEAVRCLGHLLRRCTKSRDLVARLGSDVVAIALVGADHDGALAAARRLAQMVADERLHLPDGTTFEVHAHYGVACFPGNAVDEVTLLRSADHAVKRAKELGPDRIAIAA